MANDEWAAVSVCADCCVWVGIDMGNGVADGCCVWVCCGCAIDIGNVAVPEIPPVWVDQNGCRLVTVGASSLACLGGQLIDSAMTPKGVAANPLERIVE